MGLVGQGLSGSRDVSMVHKKGKQKPTAKRKTKKSKEPFDFGVSKDEFFDILNEASQPAKKPKSDSGKSQT